jgi:hypothetical protein
MQKFIRELMQDKQGNYNLRELATLLFILIVVAGWIADQFFSYIMPEYMFYSFCSLIGAGLFGYSLERKKGEAPSNEQASSKL